MSDGVYNSIVRNAQEFGVPVERALAVAAAESNGRQGVTSEAGAIGVMQLMPDTARGLGVDPNDTEDNIRGGIKYLRQMYDRYGDWDKAHAAYNWGMGNLESQGLANAPNETRGYLTRINNYLSGMPESQNDAPKIDFRAGLQSARKSLDGKQMDNGTVGCVESVTKILSHVHPEFKKMVEDGVVNTVEGENSLHSRLEKMGVEIIPFDESKVAQDDIIFYDDKQTYQHVLVADHQDADGNRRVFGNSSSANKIMEQPLYQGQTPSWIAKVSTLQSSNAQSLPQWNNYWQQKKSQETQSEESKPLSDLNSQDSATRELLEEFAREKVDSSEGKEAAEYSAFFEPMFKDNGGFKRTAENYNAILERYGDEFNSWVTDKNSQEQSQQNQPQYQPQSQPPQLEETQPAQPQTQMTLAEIEDKIYEIIPPDKFISEDNIFGQVDGIDIEDLQQGLLTLEMKGFIQSDATQYMYKRTQQQRPPKASKKTQQIASDNLEDQKQRELWETELYAEEEENISDQNNSQDQQWVEEEEDENTEWVQQQRQQEQERHAQFQPQEIAPPKNNDIRGNTAEVITGSRKPHQIQYRVVEAKDLNSSHVIDNGGVFANKNYPVELQPRDRSRVDMQTQLISMGNNLNPADLLDARDVNQGAPTTRSDGVVLNDNGRTAAIRYAYDNGKGEQAPSDATKLSSETLSMFPQDDNVDLTHAAANNFLRAALNVIATSNERNGLTQDGGKISQDGIKRVKRALSALAYGDNGLISRMSESTDDNIRGATNALFNAAPTVAKVQAAMKSGTLHKYDLSAISDAVKRLSTLRDEGKPVQKYLQEQSLFAEHTDSAE